MCYLTLSVVLSLLVYLLFSFSSKECCKLSYLADLVKLFDLIKASFYSCDISPEFLFIGPCVLYT